VAEAKLEATGPPQRFEVLVLTSAGLALIRLLPPDEQIRSVSTLIPFVRLPTSSG